MRGVLGASPSLAPAAHPRVSPLSGSKLFRTLAAASSSDDRGLGEFVSASRSSHGGSLAPAIAAARLTVPGARMASTQGIWLVLFLF